MAESSIFWENNSTGDGISGGYVQAKLVEWIRAFFCKTANGGGVSPDYLNELAVTGTSSPVAVDTGAAAVYGFPYFNSVSENVSVPTPSGATRIDRIVLRASWSAQTVRIARVAGSEGGGAPSLTQTPNTTWEIPLAQVSITTGGVITVTDQREWLSILGDDSVDDTKAGARLPQFYRRQGGNALDWSIAGTTTYTPGAVRIQAGSVSLAVPGSGSGSSVDPITFPIAFSDKPLVFVTVLAPNNANVPIAWTNTISTTLFGLERISANATSGTAVFAWLAIGPE